MAKSDKNEKSDIYRELYVQYSYLGKDTLIFAKIIEDTNKAVSTRTLHTYKQAWLKKGLKEEVRKAKKQHQAVGKKIKDNVLGNKQKPVTTTVKYTEEVSGQQLTYLNGLKPSIEGLKPIDVIKKVCNEYVTGEYTMELLLKVHGIGVIEFERIISQEPELALLYESSKMQQRKIVFNQFNDNLIQWLKRTTDGQAEVRVMIEYEIREEKPGVYIDVPIKRYETKVMKPPSAQMLEQIMGVLKEAQTIDKTEAQQFYQLAEGMSSEQLLKEIAELQATKEARLNERKQFNTTGN